MFNIIATLVLFIAAIITGIVLLIKTKRQKKDKISKILSGIYITYIAVLCCYCVNFTGVDTELKRRIVIDFLCLVYALTDVLIVLMLDLVIIVNKMESIKGFRQIRFIIMIMMGIDLFFCLSNMLPFCREWSIQAGTVILMKGIPKNITGLIAVSGFWYLPHFAFVYLTIAFGIAIYIRKIIKIPKVYAVKYLLLTVSFCLVGLWKLYLRLVKVDYFVDISLPLLVFIAISLYLITYAPKHILMLLSTQKLIFDRIEDPVLLFDMNGLLANYNREAEKVFEARKDSLKNITLKKFIASHLEMQISESENSTIEEVNIFVPPADRKLYKLEYSVIYDRRRRKLGTIMVFNDISILAKRYQGLEGFSQMDELTSLPSTLMLQREMTEVNLFHRFPYTAITCELVGLTLIRDGLGTTYADDAIRFVADVVRSSFQQGDFVSYSNGTFNILSPNGNREQINEIMSSLIERIKNENPFDFVLNVVYGIANRQSPEEDIQNTINNAENELYENKMMDSDEFHEQLVSSIKRILTIFERENELRIRRITELAIPLGKRLGLNEDELKNLEMLAKYQDIGLFTIPKVRDNRREPLSQDEKALSAIHTVKGCQIARQSEELRVISKEILCHHEWWNGQGFPNGYKGEEIPFLSRIITVVDTYEELIHRRIYHSSVSPEEALYEIERCSETQFDPNVVKVFAEMIDLQENSGYI